MKTNNQDSTTKNLSDKKRLMIDPPSGWKYGFPKECKAYAEYGGFPVNIKVWLIANGYPESECLDDIKVRMWLEDVS